MVLKPMNCIRSWRIPRWNLKPSQATPVPGRVQSVAIVHAVKVRRIAGNGRASHRLTFNDAHVNEDVSAFVRSEICLFPTASVTTLCRPATCNVCGACLEWCLTRDVWTDDQQRSWMDNPNITQKCALSSDAVAVHNPACMRYLPKLSDLFRLSRRQSDGRAKAKLEARSLSPTCRPARPCRSALCA